MIALTRSKESNGFLRFVLTGVKKETDKVNILFSGNDDDYRIWTPLPGNEEWCEGSWISPPWRMGLLDLKVKVQVTRGGDIIFETVTDELNSRSIPCGKGMLPLFEVLASKTTDLKPMPNVQHASFKEGQQVFIIVPHGMVLRLHRAQYHTKDVTSTVEKFLTDRPNILSFGGDFNREFGDPERGVPKTLSIEYSFCAASDADPSFLYENSGHMIFDSARLSAEFGEMCIKSCFTNVLECDSDVEGLLHFHSGLYGNLPNQTTRTKASAQLRENIILECDRNCLGISRWSTLLRCSGRVFRKHVKEFWYQISKAGTIRDSSKLSSEGTICARRFCSDANCGDFSTEHPNSRGTVLGGCTSFPGALIVRLVQEGSDQISETNAPHHSFAPLLGEYCRSLFSVSGRPVYQHASGAYFMWHCSDGWCVGTRWSLGTSTCIIHSTPITDNAASSAPEDSVGWMIIDSSGAWALSPTTRCLPGRSQPDVVPHTDALLHMVRTQFMRALSDPGGALAEELRAWVGSLPHDILKGTNSLNMNIPSILKTPQGGLMHGMFDTMSWREIAHRFATNLDSDKGVACEEFLISLAAAEGSVERFVETLHAIQISRPTAPCSAARAAAHRLLLDQVDCPLLQDQDFLARELGPGSRAKFLAALSEHVPWASALGEAAAGLLACFLRHLLRAAQVGGVEHIARISDVLSKVVAKEGRQANDRSVAAWEAAAADTKVRMAIAGHKHSLAVLEDGRLFAWGLDTEGRIGVGYNTRPVGGRQGGRELGRGDGPGGSSGWVVESHSLTSSIRWALLGA